MSYVWISMTEVVSSISCLWVQSESNVRSFGKKMARFLETSKEKSLIQLKLVAHVEAIAIARRLLLCHPSMSNDGGDL